ncbi:thiamine pyrophosphokinase [Laetiporus sulphureus 93-53]|uniref:Thiamine pyrophosphokinase n=1 Tax=Laetiporus sulphureus 93-53 TaxID=1314785 RepID=A0A165ERR3_9APHY|nr:thiamine pyrophosphokinase [Laetiporus sulphureus 93-53]KZT07631.1 Thiamin pyrophosphokinase [Laetiporus sulphureus 93-53]
MAPPTNWSLPFLEPSFSPSLDRQYSLIILNQPFSVPLLSRLWKASTWRCCADGGANRLHDVLKNQASVSERLGWDARSLYLPDLIKGDLDSLRDDVREYYASHNVPIVQDDDQDSTDLMKCIYACAEKHKGSVHEKSDLIVLGGLSGRLDQTIHTLSLLYKLRNSPMRIFAVTDDNVAWVLNGEGADTSGEHRIAINHQLVGPTCGLLPVGVDSTVLSTTGLRWNLTDRVSSFDGLVSTSNHLVPEESTVWIKTTRPIWWTVELRQSGLQ